MAEQFFFYIFAFIAVISAICVVTLKNPVHSAFFLIVCLMQVAAVFVLLRAPFLAAVQVFVYVGAVMVLFLFAVMVLDLGKENLLSRLHNQATLAGILVVVLFIAMAALALRGGLTAPQGPYTEAVLAKNTEVIGKSLYTKYIYPFEIVSLVLLVALIGAVVLVMKDKNKEKAG